jgi:hypothetical protein
VKVTQDDWIKNKILETIKASKSQRQSPKEVIGSICAESKVSASLVKAALNDLVNKRTLVFTCRGGYTYVEIPCKDLPGGANRVKVVIDDKGNPWICDYDVDPAEDLAAQGCWQLRENPKALG